MSGSVRGAEEQSSAPTRQADRFSCQTLPCCVCGFSGGQMETILAWDANLTEGTCPKAIAI